LKTLFLINARSGTKRGYDVADLIRKGCSDWSSPYDVAPCERKEDLDDVIAAAIANGVEVIYAVGGDGTVHEVGKRLIGKSAALGILPTGSGNGLARHIGLPMDPLKSLRACGRKRIATIDTVEVNGMPFLGVMGVGFDAIVADRFATAGARGLKTYIRVGLRAFRDYESEAYELMLDGRRIDARAFVIAIANSSQYGNDARIAPLASLQDGLVDIVIVEDASIFSAPFLLARLFRGTLAGAHGVKMLQGAQLHMRRPAAGPAHLDGEPVTLPAELQVKINAMSLKVLLPDVERKI